MTVDLSKGPRTPVDARVRRRSRSAVARSAGGDRWLMVLIGIVLLLAGVGVTLLSYGVLGSGRAARPLLDPIMVDTMAAQPLLWLAWAARSVRPEPRPDVLLNGGADTTILVSSAAAGEAVASQAATLPGVARARARLVGSAAAPALRVTLWLADDADVRGVLALLHDEVLATARASLELTTLPVAVRLELERPQPTPRVP